MQTKFKFIAAALCLFSATVLAQPPAGPQSKSESDQEDRITVRGCLRTERGNYILIADKTGAIYALQGVGSRLNAYLRKEIEVTGDQKTGSVKTGVRPEKAGSNPSDTVHGVDGVPLQVNDIEKDIRIIDKHCKAADQQ